MPAIENQKRARAVREEIGQCYRFSILVRQGEIGRFLPDPRRSRRSRHLPSDNSWIPKGPEEPTQEQNSADREQQEIRPGKVSRNRILREKWIGKETRERKKES